MRITVLVIGFLTFPAALAAQLGNIPAAAPSAPAASAPVGAAHPDVFPDIEYISGHEGFPDKKKGQLVVSAAGVEFIEKNGTRLFALPIASIHLAEYTRDIRDASVGKKLLFGVFAGSRKQEFITVNTETESTAEGVVFKTKQNVASGIVAKVNFYVRKAKGDSAPAAGSDSSALTARKD
ncbi:MAG TPA: hypothetical protein VFS11_01065 [Gemmatimonadales bacterium]|nr:hypothetical protein [Gemmatimonadales bacterium]